MARRRQEHAGEVRVPPTCLGDITLEQAQAIFLAPDWTQEYERYFR
jgi:hypothetical protein